MLSSLSGSPLQAKLKWKRWVHSSAVMSTTVLTFVSQACRRMLALRSDCLSADSGKPYIKSFSGGRNNSPEGHAVCRLVYAGYIGTDG